VEFEFDSDKSERNKSKHGIDFVEAQRRWDDPEMIEIPARTTDEVRHLIVGRIEHKHWSAVITHRGQRTRIISVRRSRESEIQTYEST
jgi:uncharacterized DUF497 family protein